MEYTLFTKLAAEFVGTAVLMVFGNGAVANLSLIHISEPTRRS